MQYAGYNYLIMILCFQVFIKKEESVFSMKRLRTPLIQEDDASLLKTLTQGEKRIYLGSIYLSVVCRVHSVVECFLNTGLDAEIQKALCCTTPGPKITEELSITRILDRRFPLAVVIFIDLFYDS